MALIPIGRGMFQDTDDLDQPEYYYYCKAMKLADSIPYDNAHYAMINTYRLLAKDILAGHITAYDIETNEKYAFLRK